MGYACPVCSDPQADATHLANHLAFTALTGGDDHEVWLDDNVGEWDRLGESELAERVADDAESTEFPQVFEKSGVDDHDHPMADHQRADRELNEADEAVLSEARELTREMLADDEAETE